MELIPQRLNQIYGSTKSLIRINSIRRKIIDLKPKNIKTIKQWIRRNQHLSTNAFNAKLIMGTF